MSPCTSKEHKRFSFFEGLPEHERLLLSRVSGWRWVASCGHGPEKLAPVAHPRHRRWIAQKGNVHHPSHREVMLTLHGNGVYGMEGQVFARRAGTVFLFNHFEGRDWVAAPWQNDFRSLWIHFPNRHEITYNTASRDAQGRHYREIPISIVSQRVARASEIMAAWDACIAQAGDPLCWEYLKTLIASLVMQILADIQPLPGNDRHHQVIQTILNYIDTHLGDNLSLAHLARLAGYSPFSFHRIFLKQTGVRPKEYVDRVRLKKSCELLEQGYTTAAVAAEIGISSAYSFNRFFKHHLQQSPSTWRASRVVAGQTS